MNYFVTGTDTGVGKTHLLYAIAEAMTAEDVPEVLQDKRLSKINYCLNWKTTKPN